MTGTFFSSGVLLNSASLVSAQGFAANATGGKGRTTFFVSNTSDSGPGSLRHAVEKANLTGGIVDIRVSGPIEISRTIKIRGHNITITAVNAPGPVAVVGSTSFDGGVFVLDRCQNVILEELRIWRGLGRSTGDRSSAALVVVGSSTRDIIVHRCSMAWADDTIVTMWDLGPTPNNITFSHCLIYEGIRNGHHYENGWQSHSMAMIAGGSGGAYHKIRLTLHHCLIASCGERMPMLCRLGEVEIINCVCYNWSNPYNGGGFVSQNGPPDNVLVNVMGCLFIAGPENGNLLSEPFSVSRNHVTKVLHQSGNKWIKQNGAVEVGWSMVGGGGKGEEGTDEPFKFSPAEPVTLYDVDRLWTYLDGRLGPSAACVSDRRVIAYVGRAVAGDRRGGQMPDTPIGNQMNKNPGASRPALYPSWAEALKAI